MSQVHFVLLGGLEIRVDGEDLAPALPRKSAMLLAYLAMAGRPRTRQSLAGLLWGESPEESARHSLRTALWALSGRFDGCLETGRHLVGLRGGTHSVDAVDFARLAARATADGQEPPAAEEAARLTGGLNRGADSTRAALEEAAALYRGELLAGWQAGGAPAFEDWLMAERQRLQDLALSALYLLAGHQARDGALREAIATARRVLALEPWHEEAHRRLMQLLAMTGRRSEALMQYRALRRLLVLELGTEPTLETQALYRELLLAGRRAA